MFDAASWNGIAIDSTCGGHGTCKKCKVRWPSGWRRRPAGRARAFTPDELRGGWRLACRALATADADGRGAAAGHPAEGGHRRGRQAGDPAPGGAEALPGAGRADPGRPGDRPRTRAGRHGRPRAAGGPARAQDARPGAARGRLPGHRGGRGRRTDRGGARGHLGPAVRHRLRPGHHHRGRHPARPVHRHPGRGGLGAQRPAAVRRRRHHPDQRHHAGPRRPGPADRARPADPVRAGHHRLRAGRGGPGRGLRGGHG